MRKGGGRIDGFKIIDTRNVIDSAAPRREFAAGDTGMESAMAVHEGQKYSHPDHNVWTVKQ